MVGIPYFTPQHYLVRGRFSKETYRAQEKVSFNWSTRIQLGQTLDYTSCKEEIRNSLSEGPRHVANV